MITKLFVNTKVALENYKNNEQGVTAIEYGLIAAATAVVIAASMTEVGTKLQAIFESISSALGA